MNGHTPTQESSTDPITDGESRSDHDAIAAHVARAWTATNLPQSQFAEWLHQLADGYAESPELEVEAATDDYPNEPVTMEAAHGE